MLRARRDEIDTAFSQKAQRLREANCERSEQLYSRHQTELEKFKEKWQDPTFLRQFNRPSHRLLSLRELEKKMALSGMFQDAKSTKQLADTLQAEEEAAMQREIDSEMRTDFLRLRERQKAEAEKLVRHDDGLWEQIEGQRQRSINPLKVAAKRLLAEQHKKPTAHRSTPAVGTFGVIPPEPVVTSPRTRAQFARFRTKAGAELQTPSIDDSTFDRIVAGGKRNRAKSATPS
jgi:hypothetical protein